MATQIAGSGSNGLGFGNERPRCDAELNGRQGRGKVIFATMEEAEAYETRGRQQYGWEKQYVYPCPHAEHFHLTSNLQDMKSNCSQVRLADIAKMKHVSCVNSAEMNGDIKATEKRVRRHFSLEQKAEIVCKIMAGSSRDSIFKQWDITQSHYDYWRKSADVMALVHSMMEKPPAPGPAVEVKIAAKTVADLDAAEKQLEQLLAETRAKRAALIEAKRAKIARKDDTIVVVKEGSTLVFTEGEWAEFVTAAMDWSTGGQRCNSN